MKKTKGVEEKNLLYNITKPFVCFWVRRSYKKREVIGTENIPKDGSVIFAPNHCNTLMDALVILNATKEAKAFGARADLFNNKFLASFLHFLKIIPIVRKRDGIREVQKNNEIFETIVKVLESKMPFCIFPEGTHRTKHSLLPIGKGIWRVAKLAYERLGSKQKIYIVPVGIEYSDYFHMRGRSLVSFGQAIEINEFIESRSDKTESDVQIELRQIIKDRISNLITFVEDNDDYEKVVELARIMTAEFRGTMKEEVDNNNHYIRRIENKMQQGSKKVTKLLNKVEHFFNKRKNLNIVQESYRTDDHLPIIIKRIALIILGAPYFIFSSLVSLPVIIISEFIVKKFKDRAFHNSARFLVLLFINSLWLLIWAIVLLIVCKWYIAIVLFALIAPSMIYYYDYANYARILWSDITWFRRKDIKALLTEIEKDIVNCYI